MEPKFWLEKWDKNQIGFHKEDINENLLDFFPKGNLKEKRVFVPLCGKSKDLLWFRRNGMQVVGCELSEKGVHDFFDENRIKHKVKELDSGMKLYQSENIEIYQGDIFALKDVGPVDYIYDRASMIALPPEIRKKYVGKLKELFNKNFCLFLVTLEYDQPQAEGPPFSVPQLEVEECYKEFKIEVLSRKDGMESLFDSNPSLLINHVVYLIKIPHR